MDGAHRDITASLVRSLLRYLERAVGPGSARRACVAAGLDPDDPRLDDDAGWFSVTEVDALADVAESCTGDAAIGRRIGEEHFRRDDAIGNLEFLFAQGDPAGAIEFAVSHTARMVTVRDYVVVRRDDTEIVVESRVRADAARHHVHCQMLAGYWAQIPGLFGALGTVVEPSCAGRGDDRCCLIVRWDRPVGATDDELARSRRRSDGMVHRFEEMQQLAAEMASVADLPEALDRIVARAGSALLAHRFLLTIRQRPSSSAEVYATELADATSTLVADLLWDGGGAEVLAREVPELGTPIVAEVAAIEGEVLGFLVAFLPAGAAARDFDVRLLHAYAGHAAATIERIVASEAAHREHRIVRALLDLSGSLAGARSVDEVAAQVTGAVAAVTECDISGVWLLDEARTGYVLSVTSEASGQDAPRALPLADPESASRLASDPHPFTVTLGGAPTVDAVLEGWGVQECFVGPIVHRGELHGLLVAATREPIDQRDHARILDTVSALAHHAGTAIGNTVLFARISHQAMHDALTGLPNRPQIEERAADALRLADRNGTLAAITFVDLDRFKLVNDTLGHGAGDGLIAQVADRLARQLRPTDVVARLGGDEFLLLLQDLSSAEHAEEIVTRILEDLREPFDVDGDPLFVTASAGIACYPEHGRDYGTLLGRADAAMYVAKGLGRNRVAIHRSRGPGGRSLLKLESELHDAVENGELRLLFQPQVDLITDEIVAAEALVRWEHPELGLVGPDTFLATAEESGLIVEVDRWVRRAAFAQAAEWNRAGTPIRMAVNVSRRDLADAGLAADIGGLLAELDLVPELVELEITDRIVMSDEDLPPSMASLRELGVRLAVDDFGTGSSVLSRLHHCPVDVLKVDRTFVEPLSRPQPDTRLVDGLVSMAHALGMEVVIEGIEDAQQAHAVRLLGADLGQGFHLHRPMPADELGPLLEVLGRTGLFAPGRVGLVRRKPRRVRR